LVGARQVYAHQFAYERAYGPIPDGMMIRHSCDTPLCCNPGHLSLGTQQDNMNDASLRGRTLRGERGTSAKLSERDVIQIREMLLCGTKQKDIANRFGVSPSTISLISSGKNWAHFPVAS
jgi:hypothetical protein